MTAGDYFYGSKRAIITPDNIYGKPYQEKKVQTANVMQGAFNKYYYAYRAADQFGEGAYNSARYSSAVRTKIADLRDAMKKDLRTAADKPFNNNDLYWSFDHLAKNNGVWKDDTWNGWKGVCNIPIGVSDFLDTMEQRGRDIVSSHQEWVSYTQGLRQLKEQQQWEKLGSQLGNAQKVFDYVTPKLWVMLGGTEEKGASHTQLGSKWIGYGSKVYSYMDLFLKVRYNPAGAQKAAIAEAAAMVVEGLPVFGSLYAGVIRGVPGLVSWFQNYAATQRQYIDMASGR